MSERQDVCSVFNKEEIIYYFITSGHDLLLCIAFHCLEWLYLVSVQRNEVDLMQYLRAPGIIRGVYNWENSN